MFTGSDVPIFAVNNEKKARRLERQMDKFNTFKAKKQERFFCKICCNLGIYDATQSYKVFLRIIEYFMD